MDAPNSDTPTSLIPGNIRLLCISPDEPSWVSLTMQLSSRGCHEPQYRWSTTPAEAVTILRREIFDALILVPTHCDRETCFHLTKIYDLICSLRTGGHDEPALLVIEEIDDEQWGQLAAVDCDVLRSRAGWNSAALMPLILRAISRCELTRKNQHLEQSQKKHLQRGKSEAHQMLEQQRRMIHDAKLLHSHESNDTSDEIPAELETIYRQLLRTHCMMGEGSLAAELARFSEVLKSARIRATQLLDLHLREIQLMIRGIGGRSSQHIAIRANLLIIEIFLHLGEQEAFEQKSFSSGLETGEIFD